jgi:glycosyltransferase involved in cell wall biosynthesis
MNKVLHIIENFNGQAIERWLHQMMRHLNEVAKKVDWSFYAILGQPGTMDDAVKELGVKIIYSPFPLRQRGQFLKALRRAITEGEYDILHCHHDILSAMYLLASTGLPLKKRVVHVHNTSLSLPTSNPLKIYLLQEPMRQTCLYWADNIVGVSGAALDSFLKGGKPKAGRDMVIHCGIDLAPFYQKSSGRTEFLLSLGLPKGSKVILFVGRMIEYKNPCFVIDVLARVSILDPTVCAVFAGTGPLEEAVREKAEQNSLKSRVRVMGWQENIPALMQLCDLLIWPGLEEPKEGLGLGVVEAQAAGLPVLMSLNVPEDAVVVPELVEVLALAAGVDAWADKIIAVLNRRSTNREEALAEVEASSFSISQSSAAIGALYDLKEAYQI